MAEHETSLASIYCDAVAERMNKQEKVIECLLAICEFVHGLLIHGDETNEDDWTEAGKRLATAIAAAKGGV